MPEGVRNAPFRKISPLDLQFNPCMRSNMSQPFLLLYIQFGDQKKNLIFYPLEFQYILKLHTIDTIKQITILGFNLFNN